MKKRTDLTRSLPRWRVEQHRDAPLSPVPICFAPSALEAMLASVGSQPPETGAMALGPKDRLGIDAVEFDLAGSEQGGASVFRPDVAWHDSRRRFHLEQPDNCLRLWTGVIHSHPGNFGRPSLKAAPATGDLGYVEAVFAENEWLQCFLLPILTGTATDEVVIHPWVCHRDDVHSPMVAELLICEADEFPVREFNPRWLESIGELPASKTAPNTAPEIVCDSAGSTTDASASVIEPPLLVLPTAPAAIIGGSDTVQAISCAAPSSSPADGKAAEGLAHVHADPESEQVRRRREYTKRLDGLISEAFRDKTILVVGLGGGSYATEKLARLDPKRLKGCDFDIVTFSNLTRTCYSLDDVGLLKVDAMAKRIKAVNPFVKVESYSRSITEMTAREQAELFRNVDLVIAGTDQFQAQATVNELAVRYATPAVFVGVHANGDGGRIVWFVPGETGCYRCVARERYELAEKADPVRLDLDNMAACVLDIQLIDMIAMKVAVAILERGQDSHYGRFYERMCGRNDLVARCHPDYEWGNRMWDALLSDLPKKPKDYAAELRDEALLAADTIWLKGRRDPECPVCGVSRAPAGSTPNKSKVTEVIT